MAPTGPVRACSVIRCAGFSRLNLSEARGVCAMCLYLQVPAVMIEWRGVGGWPCGESDEEDLDQILCRYSPSSRMVWRGRYSSGRGGEWEAIKVQVLSLESQFYPSPPEQPWRGWGRECMYREWAVCQSEMRRPPRAGQHSGTCFHIHLRHEGPDASSCISAIRLHHSYWKWFASFSTAANPHPHLTSLAGCACRSAQQ